VLWDQKGVVARASTEWGEQKDGSIETIQAPFFKKVDDRYICFYNSAGIRVMLSEDGANYTRQPFKDEGNLLYEQGGRDVMVMGDEGTYYAYSTIATVARDGWLRGFVNVRTSKNLIQWSDYTIVSEGGRAGNGPVSAESPFVQKYEGYYYLFRSSSITGTTFVYRSKDPYNFGVNNDDKLITELPVWAPEILFEDGQWYISDIADFRGVMLANLTWATV
jgi:beta-fructofuranosidase